MPQYRKKPVVIEAESISRVSYLAANDWYRLPKWVRDGYHEGNLIFTPEGLSIRTLEGVMMGAMDDFLIKGIHDELYPCKREIFAATYELVDSKCPDNLK